jgi:hypothetical protein
MSDGGRAMWISLQAPEDWEVGEHVVQHKRTRINLWTSNGFLFCKPYQISSGFNIFDKWACHAQAKKLTNKQLAGRLLVSRLET